MYLEVCHTGARYLFYIFAAWVFSGCGLTGVLKPEERQQLPVPLEITIGAAEDVNPNVNGRPSPIVVKVFELASDARFLAADYFQLRGQAAEVLGEDLLSAEEYMLVPGEIQLVHKRADLNSRFLGIYAAYGNRTGGTWRAIAALPAPYLAGRLWTRSVSPTKYLYVLLGKSGATIYEERPAP